MGFWTLNEKSNVMVVDEMLALNEQRRAELKAIIDTNIYKPKPCVNHSTTPEPMLDVVALSKRWGLDSLSDTEYLMGLIDGREIDFLSVAYLPRSTPRKQSDVIAFEARMAFTSKTAQYLLLERAVAQAEAEKAVAK